MDWHRWIFFLAVLALMLWWLSGCAGIQADPAPPPTAIRVSTPCAALAEVPEYPKVTPDDTLKVLGQSCKAKDQQSCARAVYLLALDRERLQTWARISAVAIQGCQREN